MCISHFSKTYRLSLSYSSFNDPRCVATCYGLNGPGFESRCVRDFLPPPRPALVLSLLYSGYWVSFPGVKRPGRGVTQPTPSRAPFGTSWPVLGRTVPFRCVRWVELIKKEAGWQLIFFTPCYFSCTFSFFLSDLMLLDISSSSSSAFFA